MIAGRVHCKTVFPVSRFDPGLGAREESIKDLMLLMVRGARQRLKKKRADPIVKSALAAWALAGFCAVHD